MRQFELKVGAVPVTGLSNTEREMLRGLAQPGAPLFKIINSMVDYAEGLKQSLLAADLDDPAQLREAKKVQSTVAAAQWVLDTFNAALTDVEEKPQREEKTQ